MKSYYLTIKGSDYIESAENNPEFLSKYSNNAIYVILKALDEGFTIEEMRDNLERLKISKSTLPVLLEKLEKEEYLQEYSSLPSAFLDFRMYE